MPRELAAPLVARGQLRIIGEDQLTLDFDEFAERLERLCGENFPLPVLRHIFSITGGWSVAIEHAAAYILASSNWRDASENFPDIWPELSHWIEDNIWRDLDAGDRRRLRSEEHTAELQSLMRISYAVFCLKKTKDKTPHIDVKQESNS